MRNQTRILKLRQITRKLLKPRGKCDTSQGASLNSSDPSKKLCVFCQTEREKNHDCWENLSTGDKEVVISALKTSALESGDVDLITGIIAVQSLHNCIFYHHVGKVKNNDRSKFLAKDKLHKGTWDIK